MSKDRARKSATESMALTEELSRVLAGHRSEVIGAALADVLSKWIAGHNPVIREPLLAIHISFVREHLPISDALIRAASPEETSNWPPISERAT
jgi:hypothetical protein